MRLLSCSFTSLQIYFRGVEYDTSILEKSNGRYVLKIILERELKDRTTQNIGRRKWPSYLPVIASLPVDVT